MKVLVDFGLVILIWLVQLIIYPSFAYVDKVQLTAWHSKYTVLITFVVMPLMLGQVIFHALSLFKGMGIIPLVQAVLIAACWALTFFKAVPLHNQLGNGVETDKVIQQLIFWNWPRTILWSLVFLLSFTMSGYFPGSK